VNYGLQISASGVLTSLYRQDVYSNNLANAGTVGFKPDVPSTYPRLAAREEDGLGSMPSDALLERLGAGAMPRANRTAFDQGPVEVTHRDLDVAIRGEGFFVVRDEADGASDRVRLTRDGRFTRDSHGRLVMATNGMPVLDVGNRPILLRGGGPVTIDTDGTVREGERAAGRIAVATVQDRSQLTKQGGSLFVAPATALAGRSTARGLVEQGSLEQSAVDEIGAMMQISAAARSVDSNTTMIRYADRMMDRAINGLGRVN
jgi:flagellar basal-body rod protein FlgF